MTPAGPITRRAPGKLFITGEYAVMAPGSPAVLVGLDRHLHVTAAPAEPGAVLIRTELHPQPVSLRWQDATAVPAEPADAAAAKLQPVRSALGVLAELAAERGLPAPAVTLDITSDLHEGGTKIGLGSSGAVTTAVIAAVGDLLGLHLDAAARYRLAMIAAARLDPAGSGADLAVAAFGGWLAYRAPDRAAVVDSARRSGIEATLRADWPGHAIEALPTPAGLTLAVGWTGRPAVTTDLLGRATGDWRTHPGFVAAMGACAAETVAALRDGDAAAVPAQISEAHRLLAELDGAVGLGIFTDKLTALCQTAAAAGWAAKPSGAGGGDCGIALRADAGEPQIAQLRSRWAQVGVQYLPVSVIGEEMDAQ